MTYSFLNLQKQSYTTGAGCSVTAGIPTAQGFVEVIRKDYPRSYERAAKKTYPDCMSMLSNSEQRDILSKYVDNTKINWGHIALAQLVKFGYVDRVLTTNFDSLLFQACALLKEFPAVYDFAASQTFQPEKVPEKAIYYLHGQRTGFVLINTPSAFKKHSKTLAPVFEDAGRDRVWLVIGYSGENDPVFDHLAKVPCFDNKLYWVGYQDNEPASHLRTRLLIEGKDAYYVNGFDADTFLVTLSQMLECFPPDLVSKPFSYLENLFGTLTSYTSPRISAQLDAMQYARKFVRDAIEKIEPIQTDVLQGWADFLGGDFEKVIELQKKYSDNMHPEVADAIASAFMMQGADTVDQIRTKRGVEADALFEQAYQKYEAAVQIKPDKYEAFGNWGTALTSQARTKSGAEADALFEQAYQKYKAVLQIKPDEYEVFFNWGTALANQAGIKSGAEANALFEQAYQKYEAAVQIKPDDYEAFFNWGLALTSQARTKSGAEADALFEQAKDIFLRAEALLKGFAAYTIACIEALQENEQDCYQWLIISKNVGRLPGKLHLQRDSDLDFVRHTKWFQELIEDLDS